MTTPSKATIAIGKVSWKLAWARTVRPVIGLGGGSFSSRAPTFHLRPYCGGLEPRRGEDVDEEKHRSERENLEFDRHSSPVVNYGTSTVSSAFAAVFGIIERVVQPAAFVAATARERMIRSATSTRLRSSIRSGVTRKWRVIVAHLLAQHVDPVLGALEPLGGADDADVIPHEAADLAPGLGDHHFLVAVGNPAFVPGADLAAPRAARPNSARMCFAAASPNTRHSSRLFDARRLAPWRPDWVTSPAA